jgi:hypothetical protein
MQRTYRGFVSATIIVLAAAYQTAVQGQACYIENRHAEGLGAEQEIVGICSNNGRPIRCRYSPHEGWTCSGPHGRFTAMGSDTAVLVHEACGCGVD